MKDFEKLGVFYLGRESDPSGVTLGDARALRLARSRHPCRLRRDDGQRQNRSLHFGHRRGRDRWRAGHRHRPEGRPLEPVADVPAAGGRRTSVRGSTRTKRGCAGVAPDAYRGAAGGRWKKGLADWGEDGDRIERLRSRRRFRDLHAGQPRRAAAFDPVVVRRAAGVARVRIARRWPNARRAPR